MRYKTMIGYLLAVFLVLTLFSFSGLARQEKPKEPKGKTITLTGCLKKGDEANEFAISDGDKKYELTSKLVALEDHVGHTVPVTGTVKSEKGEEAEGWAGQMTLRVSRWLAQVVSRQLNVEEPCEDAAGVAGPTAAPIGARCMPFPRHPPGK